MVCTRDELQLLLNNRPIKSKMVEVEKSAMEIVKTTKALRAITEEETIELAEYLGVSKEDFQGPFYLESCLKCNFCTRQISFIDIVKAATEKHSKDLMAQVLCGKKGYWVTVKGKDDSLGVKCIKCGTDVANNLYHYVNSQYAYA